MNSEAPAEIQAPLSDTGKSGVNRFRPSPATEFKPGNPGKLKGTKHHSTRVREALLSQVGRQAIARFKQRLNKSRNPKEFEKALDQVIALLGPSKPLVAIDQSQHTHFTVVLDGTEPAKS